MRRLIGALALLGILTLTIGASGAAAQTYGPGLNGTLVRSVHQRAVRRHWGIRLRRDRLRLWPGRLRFTQYGYASLWAWPRNAQCGGFGSYPYLYPYTVGYPYANGVGAAGAIALSGMANPNPFFGTTGCDGSRSARTAGTAPARTEERARRDVRAERESIAAGMPKKGIGIGHAGQGDRAGGAERSSLRIADGVRIQVGVRSRSHRMRHSWAKPKGEAVAVLGESVGALPSRSRSRRSLMPQCRRTPVLVYERTRCSH